YRPWAKHFYLLTGLGYQSTSVTLGDETLAKYSNGNLPSEYKVLSIDAIVASFGLGNRWTWENGVTVGIDWAVVHVPVARTRVQAEFLDIAEKSEEGKKVATAFGYLSRVPTVALLNLGLGFNF
ncbi:MAG: hypothetical protein ABL958_21830, partial [Bdellovibrionia bacterium]